jgi:tetratricopeptide (TPR) repeat protein
MISGTQPFRAADTRRLEQRIRGRQLPAPLDNGCPEALQAIVSKLLAPDAGDRYQSATAIHDDLRRFAAGGEVVALREGWPARGDDVAATRRTHRSAVAAIAGTAGAIETEVTRRTVREAPPAAQSNQPAAAVASAALVSVAATAPAPAAVPKPRRGRLRRFVRRAFLAMALFIALNEIRVYVIAKALAPNVPQDPSGLIQMWGQHGELSSGTLHLGIMPLHHALVRQSWALADRTFSRYRSGAAAVYEREWRQTRDALQFAMGASGSGWQLRAAIKYCDGHLRRIDGEARIKSKQAPAAQQELSAAVAAFRGAAEERTDWPDPFLGLMRTFIVMEDVERGADALAQAQRLGYSAGNRDWALLGEGYLARGAKLAASEEPEQLARAAEAYTQAVDHLTKAASYGNVSQRLREARRRLAEVQERISRLSVPFELESPVGSGESAA